MPFPLLISLRESLLELCCALPVAAALGVPLQAGSRASRAAALVGVQGHCCWVCKSRRGHVRAEHALSVAITVEISCGTPAICSTQ